MAASAQPERLTYRIRELADSLGVCPRTLRARIKALDIRTVRFGRLVLVPAEEIPKLLGAEPEPKPVAEIARLSPEIRKLVDKWGT